MDELTGGFSFLRPAWLLAIPPLLLLVRRTARQLGSAGWGGRIAADKLDHLRVGPEPASAWRSLPIALSLTLACVALAGPAWRDSPDALATDRQALVVLLDLSPSMLARDIAPDRLTRARLKLVDLLRRRGEGDSALIVYADDAYRVAPLTDDPAVIEALVPTLHPDIMPRPGSRPEAAVALALALFDGARLARGDIVAITDGMHPDAIEAITRDLPPGFRLSILGVGTTSGAPIPDAETGYLRDARGATVLARLDEAPLAELAMRFGGRYTPLSIDDSDVDHLAALARLPLDPRLAPPDQRLDQRFDRREDGGYWLVLALLPLLAYGFRRHLLWLALPLVLTGMPEARADWRGLWLSDDQRGARALARGDAQEAARRFRSPRWRAIAHYRDGDPGAAAALLADAVTPDDHYNLGNALALAGDLPAALAAYGRALALYPDNDARAADARFNRDAVQALLDAREDAADGEERDSPPPRGGSGEQDDDGGGEDEENESGEDDARAGADSARQRIGGTAGGGVGTLEQQALDGEGRASDARHDGEPEDGPAVPDEAMPVPEPQAVTAAEPPANGRDADNALPSVEANANRVLTPYGERWLRALPQDPGGYLRRKFQHLAATRSPQPEPQPEPEPETRSGTRTESNALAPEPRH